MIPKSFFKSLLPIKANLIDVANSVALLAYPPVLEYISVSKINTLRFLPLDNTWSNPPNPIS